MYKKRYKKTILIDLDGVLNQYDGSYDKDVIPPIKYGAREFLEVLNEVFKIVIFTTRPIKLTSEWLDKNNINQYVYDITNVKIPAFLIVDDRAICYNGNYDETLNKIINFVVHWKN